MQETLLDLIAKIHDAAINPEIWDRVMEEIAALIGGHAISVQRFDLAAKSVSVEMASGIDPDLGQLYAERYAGADPWFKLGAHLLDTGKVGTGAEFIAFNEMAHTEVFNEVYGPLEISDFVGLMVEKNGREWRWISVNCPPNKQTFSSQDKRILSTLFPHLRSAIAVRDKLLSATSRIQEREAALHNLAAPILLLARSGRVLFANASAESLISSTSPISILRRRCQFADINARNILDSALANPSTAQSFAIARDAGLPPWVIHLTPVSPETTRRFLPQAGDAVLLLSVSDPLQEFGNCNRVDPLIRAFGFTQAEAEVAHHLAAVRSIDDIARSIERSRETVRTHVKSLLSKTGTRRQAELISLLLRSRSPFEQDQQ